MTRTGLVLIAHGSKDARWRATFERFRDGLRRDVETEAVELCYMDLAKPTLSEICRDLAARQIQKVLLFPLFMSGGGHVDHDIPKLVSAARAAYPALHIEVLSAVGEHPAFLTALKTMAEEALKTRNV